MLQHLIKPLISPKAVDFWAGEFGAIWRWQRPLARIVERRVEAKNVVTLLLKANRHFAGFRAGQHINVTVEVNGARMTRSYSLSDAPRPDGLLAITVKKDGVVSTHLCRHSKVGDVVELGQAFGDFDMSLAGQYLLLAAGSGITPLISLIRQQLSGHAANRITLVYWAKTRADWCFVPELQALARQYNNFAVHFALTADTALEHELQGRISAGLIARVCPDLSKQHVLACGSAGFVDSVRQALAGQALSVQVEAFTPPMPSPDHALGTVRVELALSQKVLELSTGASLLDALEAQGVYPPSGCRMGICHTCSCQKLTGLTEDLLSAELNAEPGAAVKLCASRARSDLVLAL